MSEPSGSRSPITVTLTASEVHDVADVIRLLPDPSTLESGTRIEVLGTKDDPRSISTRFIAAIGRGKVVPRALRCTALVARGYVSVGAHVEPATKRDVAYGLVP